MADQDKKMDIPAQHQDHQPGSEQAMTPRPLAEMKNYKGSGKLSGKVALVTGGDSGIGRATAIGFAKEGANVLIAYLDEHEDAKETQKLIEAEGRKCVTIAGDIGSEDFCRKMVETAIASFGQLDIVVNNAAQQYPQESIEGISEEQLLKTFRTNIFSMFFTVKAALKHLKPGSRIINTTSVTAYRGSPQLLDYSSTKGAIVAFTRSLSKQLISRGILVNAVAPGPVWTPLIPSSFSPENVEKFGEQSPMGRAGQPDEIAPSYIFLASEDASFMSGQVLHPNGGDVVNS